MATKVNRADLRALRVLDVIKDSVAILDGDGFIVQTNKAWDDFASRNSPAKGFSSESIGVGSNYLNVCRNSKGRSAENAFSVSKGIMDILAGRKRTFSLEYPCHSPTKQRWFVLTVSALRGIKPKEVVVVHHEITSQRLAEIDAIAKQRELLAALEQLQDLARQIKESAYVAGAWPGLSLAPNGTRPKGNEASTREPDPSYKVLSKREKEVLCAIARGERNGDISKRLQLSTKSVSTYRSRILVKLKVRNDAELVSLVTRQGTP